MIDLLPGSVKTTKWKEEETKEWRKWYTALKNFPDYNVPEMTAYGKIFAWVSTENGGTIIDILKLITIFVTTGQECLAATFCKNSV